MKVKYRQKVKEFQKGTSSNLLMVSGIFAIDLITIMLDVNSKFNNNTATDTTQLILNWAVLTYIISFSLLFFTYKNLNKKNFKLMRRFMLIILAITVMNLFTFVYAGHVFSIMLVVPILMLIYMAQRAKEFAN